MKKGPRWRSYSISNLTSLELLVGALLMRAPMRSWRTPILCLDFFLMFPRMPRLHSIKGPFKLVLGGIWLTLLGVKLDGLRLNWFNAFWISYYKVNFASTVRLGMSTGLFWCLVVILRVLGARSTALRNILGCFSSWCLRPKICPIPLRRSVPLGNYLTIRHNSFKNFTVRSLYVNPRNLKVLLTAQYSKCIFIYWPVNAWCHYFVLISKDLIRRKLLVDLPLPLQGLLSGDSAIETAENRTGDLVCAMVAWFPFSWWEQLGPAWTWWSIIWKVAAKEAYWKFLALLAEIHPQAASEIEQQVCWPVDGTQFDAEGICAFLLRRLAGLDEPQQWNPFRWFLVPQRLCHYLWRSVFNFLCMHGIPLSLSRVLLFFFEFVAAPQW